MEIVAICVSKEDFEEELSKHDGEMRMYQVAGTLDSDGFKSESKSWRFASGEYSVIRSDQYGEEISYYFMKAKV